MAARRVTAAPRHDAVVAGGVVLALAAAYGATLAPSVTWANGGADSGDLVTAAAVLGVAHPTGYPTYLLLARLFQLIPAGELAYRTALLSAAAALGAALITYALIRALSGARGWPASLGSGLGALALGASPLFWSQAVIPEVLSLNALFVAAILWFTLRDGAADSGWGWPARLRAVAVGLALGNHVTVALPAALWLGTAGLRRPAEARWRAALRRLPWVAAGLLVYLYLPLRAAARPSVNWGDPRDIAGMWWVVSGELYRHLAFGVAPGALPARIGEWAGLLVAQFGAVGVACGLAGLLYGAPGRRWFIRLSGVVAAGYSSFAIGYDTAHAAGYLLPAALIFALWIGLAAARLCEAAARRMWGGAQLAALLLALAVLWPLPHTMRRVDASRDHRAAAFARAVLRDVPPGAVVLTSSDLDTFALWYAHLALGQRPDIAVVADPLLDHAWYRAQLRDAAPWLRVPEPAGGNVAKLFVAANSQRPICRTDPLGAAPVVCALP